MSPRHHPPKDLLAEFAGSALRSEQHVVVSTHLRHCAACRAQVALLDEAGGAVLDALPPASLMSDAFARIEARLGHLGKPASAPTVGPWMRPTPHLEMRRIDLGLGAPHTADGDRLLLFRALPGAKLIRHTHTGREMTCVLTGSFSDGDHLYTAGDFALGTPEVAHEIVIGAESACVSLVALQGKVKLSGFLGWLLQPLVRI